MLVKVPIGVVGIDGEVDGEVVSPTWGQHKVYEEVKECMQFNDPTHSLEHVPSKLLELLRLVPVGSVPSGKFTLGSLTQEELLKNKK